MNGVRCVRVCSRDSARECAQGVVLGPFRLSFPPALPTLVAPVPPPPIRPPRSLLRLRFCLGGIHYPSATGSIYYYYCFLLLPRSCFLRLFFLSLFSNFESLGSVDVVC